MNPRILLFSLVVFALLANPVSSQTLEYYGIETRLDRDMTARNSVILIFDSEIQSFDYRTKYEIYNLQSESEYGEAECVTRAEVSGTVISCNFVNLGEVNKTQVQFDFETGENVVKTGEDYTFDSIYLVDLPVQKAFSIVYLPETATIKTDVSNESYTPRYGKTLSDGRHIMVYWEKDDVKKGDDLEFSVNYIMPAGAGSFYDVAIIVIIAFVLIVVIAVGYVKRIHGESSVRVVMPVLKKDEKRIIDILAERKGQAIQRVLVRESDFSKAKVSRLVASLKERGILEVEHLGRTNRVILKLKR
jgi:uncharacterized membrane protein